MKLACIGVLCVAALLRLHGLSDRPMHADEAVLADKLGTLLETGSYRYDPQGYHGPVLLYATIPVAWARGQRSYARLDEWTLRLVPALAGIAVVGTALAAWLATRRRAFLLGAVFLAVSPAMVYYSRSYIPEMVLVAASFAVLLLPAARVGAFAGIMLAAKETAVLALAAAAAARRWTWREAAISAGVAAAVAAVILSSFFRHPAGPLDYLWSFAGTYFARAFREPLHRHPWYYYFGVLGRIELPLLLLAAAGAWRDRSPVLRTVAVYTVLLLGIYCLLPYKTPWSAMGFWLGVILLAGAGGAALIERFGSAAGAALVVVSLWLAGNAWHLSHGTAATDPGGNPYVYAQTLPDVFTIEARLKGALRASPDAALAVYSRENLWPLPWYLRSAGDRVRWWNAVSRESPVAPVVLLSPPMEPEITSKIYEDPPPGRRELYMNLFDEPVYLRPGVELRGYVSKAVWDRMQQLRP